MSKLPFAVVLAFSSFVVAAPAQRNRRDDVPPPDLKCGTFAEHEFDSDAMGRKIPYGIYLPKTYDAAENKDRKDPLVVWLHGMWEDHMRFHGRGGSQALDDLIAKNEVPELILVSPSPGRSSFYINGKNSGLAEDLIVKDLMRHLESTYRVEPGRDRRALMGVSMGGMGALKIAFKHPELFATVATHSAAVFPADLDKLSDRFKNAMKSQWLAPVLDETFGDPIDRELWQDNNPLALVAEHSKTELCTLQIYFDAGTKDRYGFDTTNEQLDAALTGKGVAHTWRKIEGGGHSWGEGLAKSSLPDSLRFVAKEFAKAAGKAALGSLLHPESGDGNDKKTNGERKND